MNQTFGFELAGDEAAADQRQQHGIAFAEKLKAAIGEAQLRSGGGDPGCCTSQLASCSKQPVSQDRSVLSTTTRGGTPYSAHHLSQS